MVSNNFKLFSIYLFPPVALTTLFHVVSVFFVQQEGYDNHDNLQTDFNMLMLELDGGFGAFVKEMKFVDEMNPQRRWDEVTVVMVSEFARTLTVNTGLGTDHGWGGNYFVAGGSISGKKILGEYPDTLTPDGDLIIEPGIVIPTTSWDALWNGLAQVSNTFKLFSTYLLSFCTNCFSFSGLASPVLMT